MIISKKHGLNPSIGVCFWCSNPDGKVLLLGANGGKEAPRYTCTGYEPCDECKEKFSLGILLFEASAFPVIDGQPSAKKDEELYPTGRFMVVKEEVIPLLFRPEEMVKQILLHRKAAMDRKSFTVLMSKAKGQEEG